MVNPMQLDGKHVLVTGASQGIGRSVVELVSQLGAKISLVARNEEKLSQVRSSLPGGEHCVFPFDLTNNGDIEDLVKRIIKSGGPLHGLVHCAGIGDVIPLQMTKFDRLHKVLMLNYYSFVELIRCCSKKGNYTAGASFVGLSSVGSFCGLKSQIAYCSSKAAMDAAVKCAAHELSTKKIRVNSVAPSCIKTEMFDDFINVAGEATDALSKQYLGVGEPVDVANAVAYLLGDAAKFITGTTLIVDGGYLS